MSVRAKLYSTVLILLCLTATISYMGISSLYQYKDRTESLSHAAHRVNKVQQLRVNLLQFSIDLNRYAEKSGVSYNELTRQLTSLRQDVKYLESITINPMCKKKLKPVSNELGGIIVIVKQIPRSPQGQDNSTIVANSERAQKLIDKISGKLAETGNITSNTAGTLRKESLEAYAVYRFWLILVSILAVITGIVLSYTLTKGIMDSVRELYRATQEFINGNRNRRIDKPMSGEFAMLADAYNSMANSVHASECEIKTWNEKLEKQIGERTIELQVANEEIDQKMKEITAYLEITKALSSTTEITETLSLAVDTLSTVFETDYAAIALIDEDSLLPCWSILNCKRSSCPAYKSSNLECWAISQTHCGIPSQENFTDKIPKCRKCRVFKSINTRIAALSGIEEKFFLDKELPISRSLCGQAILTLNPVIHTGFDQINDTFSIQSMAGDCVSQVTIPLITRDRVLGSIAFGFKSNRSLDRREIDFLVSVSNQVAIAIENFKLYDHAKNAAARYSTLYRAGTSLESTVKKDEIANHFLKHAMEMSQAEAGAILLIDQQTQTLETSAQFNISDELLPVLGKRAGNGIAGWVAKTGKPVVIDKRIGERRFNNIIDKIDFRAAMFVPLRYNEEVFGVLGLISLTGRHYDDSDLQPLTTLCSQASATMHNVQLFGQLKNLYYETIKAFVQAIEAKDSYTRGHSENVAEYAIAIAAKMNLSNDQIELLQTAALLHDIGKIGIKEDVLNKPDRLTPEEYDHIKEHPIISSQIINHIPMLEEVGVIIRHHHERYDGNGYPDGLKGEAIPLGSRILAVADTFDAMTSNRTYRNATPVETAKGELLKNAGTQFDPQIVGFFVELLDDNELPRIASMLSNPFHENDSETSSNISA